MGITAGRGARLFALALATGTLTAAAGGVAGASAGTVHTTRNVVASADGAALELTVNLPASIPGIGQTITQKISFTNGKISTISGVSALSRAVLGAGNTPLVSSLLNKSTVADLTHPSASQSLISQQLGPVDVGVGLLSSQAASPATTAKTLSASSSKLVHITVAGSLPTQLNSTVLKPVTDVLGNQLGDSGQTVATTLNNVVGQLDQQAQNTPAAAVADAAKATATQLTNTLSSLQNTLNTLSQGASLLSLDAISSGH